MNGFGAGAWIVRNRDAMNQGSYQGSVVCEDGLVDHFKFFVYYQRYQWWRLFRRGMA